jgi:hypothetical protein
VNHPIPARALDHHIAVLGKTGSGKTYAAKGVVEGILSAGGRACIVDPTGVWWGLRSDARGKAGGFPVAVFGGGHADLPLGSTHGEALAEIVGTSSTPAILDTSLMRVGERTRFFTDFADGLVRKNKGPLHLVIDEAHLFAPQGKVADPLSGQMLHAANNLVSLGRSRGLRIILISQRPAKIHKDSLTQVETLVAMRLIAPQDRRAVEEWIADNADQAKGREIIASLATLKTGQGWVWAPELGVLDRVAFPKISTFDTSRAPDGEAGRAPVLAPIDIKAVHARLDTIATEARANDPRVLKAEIARLTRELADARRAPAADPKAAEEAEARGYTRGKIDGYSAGVADATDDLAAIRVAVSAALNTALGEIKAKTADHRARASALIRNAPAAALPRPAPSVPPRTPFRAKAATPSDPTLGAERKPLSVLASVYPAGMTEAQWAVGSRIKRTGGTWSTYKSRLRAAGRIEERGDLWYATEQGRADLGENFVQMPLPGPELVAYWAERVSGAAPMLRHLAKVYPRWLTRDALAADLGIEVSGGTFSTYLSRLRSPGLIEEGPDKTVRASESLMGSP